MDETPIADIAITDSPDVDTIALRRTTRTTRSKLTSALVNYSTLFVLIVLVLAFGLLRPHAFFSTNNLQNLFVQAAPGAVAALALTLTLMVGEFDLSIGYMASLAGMLVFGFMVNEVWGFGPALVTTLAICALLGTLSGLVVAKLKVNAFIGTLGVGFLAVGIIYAFSGGATIAGDSPDIVTSIGLGRTLGISNLTIIWAIVSIVLWVATERTRWGIHLRAVGGNDRAASLVGLNISRIRWSTFICSASFAAIAGVMLACRLGSGEPTAGDSFLLDGFAAAFLGRGFYRPGEFNVPGTIVGALVLQVGYSGLALMGFPTAARYFFAGFILIVALALGTVAGSFQGKRA